MLLQRLKELCDRLTCVGMAIAAGVIVTACGGGAAPRDDEPRPSISILEPTNSPTYSTTGTGVTLGGSISHAGFVHVTNTLTGSVTEGFVFYASGQGSWFAEVYGLRPGENPITVVADGDGTGRRTAIARIVIIRPLQPLNLIFNGLNADSSSTFWVDETSVGQSHKLALFEDGTGRSTTGSALSDDAGAVAGFTWSMLGADSIQIENCPTCSFQSIAGISGSLGEGFFYGQIETVGGAGEVALHVFRLVDGQL